MMALVFQFNEAELCPYGFCFLCGHVGLDLYNDFYAKIRVSSSCVHCINIVTVTGIIDIVITRSRLGEKAAYAYGFANQ